MFVLFIAQEAATVKTMMMMMTTTTCIRRHHRHVAPTPKIKTQHQSDQQIISASNGYVQVALFSKV